MNQPRDLFTATGDAHAPLAERLRPKKVEDMVGQRHLLGEGKPLWVALRAGKPHSMILWGPPGVGKTTLARLMANAFNTEFIAISAVLSGVKEIRDAGTADGLAWVEATPKAQDTGFERVRLGLQGKTLAAMELYDQLGGHTMLRFSDLKANAPVAADIFRFAPPKGADVLEDAPARK